MEIMEFITYFWLFCLTIGSVIHWSSETDVHGCSIYGRYCRDKQQDRYLSDEEKEQFWCELTDLERHKLAKEAMDMHYNPPIEDK